MKTTFLTSGIVTIDNGKTVEVFKDFRSWLNWIEQKYWWETVKLNHFK